jgi:hypothetical protein
VERLVLVAVVAVLLRQVLELLAVVEIMVVVQVVQAH